jgi:hypothetical protein
MSYYSLIAIIIFIPLTSFAQLFPPSMVGHYEVRELSCLPHHSFFENVHQIVISDSQVLTLDTCDLNDDCEGRQPYFHFYLRPIENQIGWYSGNNDILGSSRFMLKQTTSGDLLMRIDVQQSNSNQKISCYGNLSKI